MLRTIHPYANYSLSYTSALHILIIASCGMAVEIRIKSANR